MLQGPKALLKVSKRRNLLLDKPSPIRHFLSTTGGGRPLTSSIKVQGDATAATQPARAFPSLTATPTHPLPPYRCLLTAASTNQPHTLRFHPHCSAPLNRKKKPEIHVFLFGLSRAVPVAQESRIQLVKKREEKSEAATMQK